MALAKTLINDLSMPMQDRPSFEVGERVAYFSEATSSFWCGKVLESEPASEHYKLQTSPLQTQVIPAIDILRFQVSLHVIGAEGFLQLQCLQENSESPFQWKKGGAIGEGAFGSVLEAMDLRTGQRLAVKEIKIESHSKDSSNEELEQKVYHFMSIVCSYILVECAHDSLGADADTRTWQRNRGDAFGVASERRQIPRNRAGPRKWLSLHFHGTCVGRIYLSYEILSKTLLCIDHLR